MSDTTFDPNPERGSLPESWARIIELAREVLRERGLSDREIDAELHAAPLTHHRRPESGR